MNNLKNELSQAEMGTIKSESTSKLKNILNPLMIIFGAFAAFVSEALCKILFDANHSFIV